MIPNPEHIKTFVRKTYYYIGENKQQEISRLVFEIAKREYIDYTNVVKDLPPPPSRFSHVKDYLLKRRYPSLGEQKGFLRPSFCDITINPALQVTVDSQLQNKPKNIFIEESVLHTEMVKHTVSQFPESNIETIRTYKEQRKEKRFGIEEYNRRAESMYLIRENYDFYKRCPCSNHSVSCGYFVVNLGSGCPYECSYCVLQDYINAPGMILPANIEDFFIAFQKLKRNLRCGSGELTDSLVFDHITRYSPQIVEFFRQYPESIFEFKTKSRNIEQITSIPGAKNIVVSWSVNPQSVIDTAEYFTASLTDRLNSARRCVEHGYRVAFHFDPIIYYQGWETDYEKLVRDIFKTVDAVDIAWISLGTLRMTPRLKRIIENRFPDNTILDEEFFIGHDSKLRYPREIRRNIYTSLKTWIYRYSRKVPLYLCMEEKSMRLNEKVFH